jgi:6-pyruvoyl-tetrahydropterin synthase
MTKYEPVSYKYTSTKEWHDAFPCAYRQWRADSHCNQIHGYSFTIKVYFGADTLDARNWCADYGGLKDLKAILEDQFDHTLLVAEDDPDMDMFKLLQERGMAKLTIIQQQAVKHLPIWYIISSTVSIFLTIGARVKLNDSGAIV